MHDEERLSNTQLFASWAREDFHAWHHLIGASVTHLSRGDGKVINVSREEGVVSIHIHYAKVDRAHPLWEFRTEFTSMTLPERITRDDLIPVVKERRLLLEQEKKQARSSSIEGQARTRR